MLSVTTGEDVLNLFFHSLRASSTSQSFHANLFKSRGTKAKCTLDLMTLGDDSQAEICFLPYSVIGLFSILGDCTK